MKEVTSVFLAWSLLTGLVIAKDIKPNVLFIAVDDLKPMLGSYGDSQIQTPNIDEISDTGIVFKNNHAQVPICGASRVSLLTGTYSDRNRVLNFEKMRKHLPDVITLPEHFKNNGYATLNIGKIFDFRTTDGFTDSRSWTQVFSSSDLGPFFNKETGRPAVHYQDPNFKTRYRSYQQEAKAIGESPYEYAKKRFFPATENLSMPDDAYNDGAMAKLAAHELDRLAKQEEPFFLAIGFARPHLPFVAPRKYWDLYQGSTIGIAELQTKAENDVDYAYKNKAGEIGTYTAADGKRIFEPLNKGGRLPDSLQRELVHGYMATVSYIDAQIGVIYDSLKANGLVENTIIVLWGDHGFHLGDHGIWTKHTNFEQASRTPLIICAPGIKPGETQVATELIDIYPTLTRLAKLDTPEHVQGQDLSEVMHGDNSNQYAYGQYARGQKMGYFVRDKRYRLVVWVKEGLHCNPEADLTDIVDKQLFDYEVDPLESINYAGTDRYEKIEQRLTQKFNEFVAQ